MFRFLRLFILSMLFSSALQAQQSIARQWNEVMLDAIREDLARPPVQARNLFHVSVAMYDAWAAYSTTANTYLLGNTIGGTFYPYSGITFPLPTSIEDYRKQAISYAVYRVLVNRFSGSPNASVSLNRFNTLMANLGYTTSYTSANYTNNDPRDLGNYIGAKVIEMGLADGARQQNNYAPANYAPVNPALNMSVSGNSTMTDPNRWQRLFLTTAFDQSGNPIPSLQNFICPEWGKITPFGMPTNSATIYTRDGGTYPVYHDPGPPPMLDTVNVSSQSSIDYKWGHTMVSLWSAHHTPNDNVLIDISPKGTGNVLSYPTTIAGQKTFYNTIDGGDPGLGRTINPITGTPYIAQMVKRGDFSRVASQYWADGPSSETPPGHWFKLLNGVSDHPSTQKKYEGIGALLSNLEWDVKTYLTLGGAMHDAAISCWGAKGYYDSPRPISAIRKMARYGQSSDPMLPSYHPGGITLIPGYIELITATDPLAAGGANVNKIKLKSWRGFSFIVNPYDDVADVGWILADNWTAYQRSTFVTPPFAGYYSGHSTFSSAGAEVLTKLTGSKFFPGGMGEYVIPANAFYLGFENGPSADIKLQWATYKDASDQASLSRIWGGIHPPFDDIPGRLIGEEIGVDAFLKAKNLFTNTVLPVTLLSFNTTENNCAVDIKWTTSNEINVKSYTIWRSENGVNFNTKIAEIDAQIGNSSSKNYSAVDASPFAYSYYKLVEIAVDGKRTEFPIVISKLSKCNLVDKVAAIAPNPVKDIAKLTIQNVTKNKSVAIGITDETGKLVMKKTAPLQNGFSTVEIDFSSLSSGNYFVTIVLSNGFKDVQKIVK
jgi:Secretion system C-terminal sorting domain